MENKIPRIVLIGVGGYGTLYVEEILRDVDAGICTFVGAADPAAETSPRYAELTARRIPVYPTPEALFEAQTADICCIAAPIQYHTPYTLLALRNGCHVLCEKPLSGDWKDARLITDAAEKAGKVVLCGYQWSHSDAILALKRDIMEGRFGAPKHLSTRIFWPRSQSYFRRGSGWAGKRYAADGTPIFDSVANNAAAHYLHNMLFVLGDAIDTTAEPLSVDAELLRVNPIENFDSCVLRVRLACGADALFIASHSTAETIDPVFTYEFEHGTVTYAQDDKKGITAVFDDGTTKTYGDPFADSMNKVRYVIRAAAGADGELPCTAMTAAAHARIITAIADAPIAEVPDTMCDIVMMGADQNDPLRVVRGLADAMRAAYDRGCLLSELDGDAYKALQAILIPTIGIRVPRDGESQ